MRTITVKNVEFGKGKPKICIPIMGKDLDGLKNEIESLNGLAYDIIEWRMDHFKDILNPEEAQKAIQLVGSLLKDTVLLATFRTSKEGGEMAISNEDYVALNKQMIDSDLIDFVDVECFTGDKEVSEIVEYAHAHGVYVVMSNHDFHKTPDYEEIVSRLKLMQEKEVEK